MKKDFEINGKEGIQSALDQIRSELEALLANQTEELPITVIIEHKTKSDDIIALSFNIRELTAKTPSHF